MIKILREQEEIMLYQNIFVINHDEEKLTKEFLINEFERESLQYPGRPPSFDIDSAFWAAKTIYYTAQLILYRKDKPENLEELLLPYKRKVGTSQHLSADLCLRFLPQLIYELKIIDTEDPIIVNLELIMDQFPYCGIQYLDELDLNGLDSIRKNTCLYQLFINRIIKFKKTKLLSDIGLRSTVDGFLGNYKEEYWKNYQSLVETEFSKNDKNQNITT